MTNEMEMPAGVYALRYTRMVNMRVASPMAYWAIALLVFLGLLLNPYGGGVQLTILALLVAGLVATIHRFHVARVSFRDYARSEAKRLDCDTVTLHLHRLGGGGYVIVYRLDINGLFVNEIITD